jgi:uncharacterized lipoprotein
MGKHGPRPAPGRIVAAATLALGLVLAACSARQRTEQAATGQTSNLVQTATPSLTVQPVPRPAVTPSPSPESSLPEIAPDFTLPQAAGPDFNLARQLAQGPVVIAFFRQGGG